MSTKKDKSTTAKDVGLGLMQDGLVQKHGEGASQIVQAYKGVRYDSAGNDIGHQGRNLKDISNYKVNDNHADANIKQQAGFSGELVKEARDNQEAILKGDTTRTRRVQVFAPPIPSGKANKDNLVGCTDTDTDSGVPAHPGLKKC